MHSSTLVIEPALGTFGSEATCQVLEEDKKISFSVEFVSMKDSRGSW